MAGAALLHLLRTQSKHLHPRSLTSGFQAYRSVACFQPGNIKPVANSAVQFNTAQKRWAWQGSNASREDDNKITIGPRRGQEEEHEEGENDFGVVYYGPISSTIKKVKLLSLSTCCLSVSLGPVITFMTSPDMNVILKGAVASTVIFLSASTTAALHWFVSPYVHIRWKPGSDSFEVEMLSWLATHLPRPIKFADIQPPKTNRPFVTFKANGNFYFVDKDHSHNKALLARLTGWESSFVVVFFKKKSELHLVLQGNSFLLLYCGNNNIGFRC